MFNIDVLVDIHDLGPAFHGDALENGQESGDNVVEVGEAPIKLIMIGLIDEPLRFKELRLAEMVPFFDVLLTDLLFE